MPSRNHLFSLFFLCTLTTPCLAASISGDVNADGVVDMADVDRMRETFMTNDARADLNGDGQVDYADLAALRSVMPGASSLHGATRGGLPIISITPPAGTYNVGDTIQTLVAADFTVDPTIGGTFDIVYDDSVLDVFSVEVLPLGDPLFAVSPNLLPGLIQGTGFGDFAGVVSGDVAIVTYEVIAPVIGPDPATAVTMQDGTGGGGPFFSAATFTQQTIDYQGANYDLPEIPQYPYVGVITGCSTDCDDYVSLGGSGAANPTPSYLTGRVNIDVEPGNSFSSTDIVGFRFELGNNGTPGDPGGDPATANPYVIDATQATIDGSGNISASGVLDVGQLTLTLTAQPWLTDQAVLDVDIDALQFTMTFDAGATVAANGEGGFVGQALPGRILVAPTDLDFGTLEVGDNANLDTVIQNLGLEDLDLGTIAGGNPLSPPFELSGGDTTLFGYTAEATVCLGTCDSFAALGGPGGAVNPIASTITGTVAIAAAPGQVFGFDNVDPDFDFEIVNQGAPMEAAIFAPDADPRCDGFDPGALCNPTTANPLPLTSAVAELRQSEPTQGTVTGGSLDDDGDFASGLLLFEFVAEPFSSNAAWAIVDLATGTTQVCLFYSISGCIPAATETAVFAGGFQGTGTGCSGRTLPPGQTCEQSVQFAPQAVDVFNDAFDVPSSDAMTPVVTVNVAGESFANPDIAATPPNVDFGETAVGAAVTMDIAIGNIGTADLNLGTVGADDPLDAPFAVTVDNCSGQTVTVGGADCTITVEFSPQVNGDYTDAFSVSSDDPDQPLLLVDVAGRTGQPNIVATPLTTRFGEIATGTSAPAVITIGNNGTNNLILGAVGADDPLDPPFGVVADGCSGQTLAPAGECTLEVEFAPQEGGAYGDNWSVASDDPDDPVISLRLTGRTIAPATVLTVSGVTGGYGRCENLAFGTEINVLLFGANVLDCGAVGLQASSGVPVRAAILAQVDDSGGPITGSVSGQTPAAAVCVNSVSGESVIIPLSEPVTSWDCTAEGLVAAPGDQVIILVGGITN